MGDTQDTLKDTNQKDPDYKWVVPIQVIYLRKKEFLTSEPSHLSFS